MGDTEVTRPKESYALQKVTLNLRMGDWNAIRVLHGRTGASKVIRDMVKEHVDRLTNRPIQSDIDAISAAIASLKDE